MAWLFCVPQRAGQEGRLQKRRRSAPKGVSGAPPASVRDSRALATGANSRLVRRLLQAGGILRNLLYLKSRAIAVDQIELWLRHRDASRRLVEFEE